MYFAFPPHASWYLAVISLGALYALLVVGGPRARTGAWLGFAFGLGFFVPLLPWIGEYVGPLPWLALATVMAGYLALFGVIATVTMRLPVAPVWFSLAWVLVEAVRSAFPFGGFPWGRTAFSQVDGPLLPLASILGAPGLSAAVALFGSAGAWCLLIITESVRGRGRTDMSSADTGDRPEGRRSDTVTRAAVAAVLTLAGPLSAILVTPDTVDRTVSSSTVNVAAIQGNVPRLGLDFNAQRRAVLDNHVNQTQRYAAEVYAGTAAAPDLVLWPENASDISPLTNADAADEITAASQAVDAPILVGTLIRDPDSRPTNTVLVWDQERGPVDRYDKHIIQPFGEYLPWRSFFRMFSSYADMAGNFRAGTGPATVDVPTRTRSVRVGISTCWEIAFDRSARQAVDDGAEFLFVPTNNATFGRTNMTYQQLAMSQVRAVEHGRSVVVAATSGVSAIIGADGMIESESEFFTPQTLTSHLALRSDTTIATRLGSLPQTVAIVIAVAAFLFAIAGHTRFSARFPIRTMGTGRRRDDGADPTPEEIDGIAR
ncbi:MULTISPECIES: apolipoprotein N-acyltransferase [Gordonia]|nr:MULTISPECIES: apolipoprotein N-acyltransferase [Gordonia]MBD0021433.1 apolipoprotein N-acyltransferase [Gordonia sp. (in: high G+C Gram-positive bacteria)]